MDDLKIDIPIQAMKIINTLEKNGYNAYVVGGCVRDVFMGKTPSDWDITTSSSPEETIECFKGEKLVLSGIKHGTVCIVIDEKLFEITSFRFDGKYSDNRHPDKVSFVRDINLDLSRRDFTVNAMAYSPTKGLVDPFGGLKDIKSKTLRCVGNAPLRFEEDALRIMRALRFSCTLGFEIEKNTSLALHEKRNLLSGISSERIRDELSKLLIGKNVFNVLYNFSDVIFTIIPELSRAKNTAQNCKYHCFDVWTHILKTVDAVEDNIYLRLTMLFHDIGKPYIKTTDINGIDHFKSHAVISSKMAYEILKGLKFDKKTVSLVTSLILHHDDRLYDNLNLLPQYIGEYGYDFLKLLDKVSRADIKGQNPKYFERIQKCDNFLEHLKKCEEENICVKISDLKIDGNDLKKLGLVGVEIGLALKKILEKVMNKELPNEKKILIEFAKNLKK